MNVWLWWLSHCFANHLPYLIPRKDTCVHELQQFFGRIHRYTTLVCRFRRRSSHRSVHGAGASQQKKLSPQFLNFLKRRRFTPGVKRTLHDFESNRLFHPIKLIRKGGAESNFFFLKNEPPGYERARALIAVCLCPLGVCSCLVFTLVV